MDDLGVPPISGNLHITSYYNRFLQKDLPAEVFPLVASFAKYLSISLPKITWNSCNTSKSSRMIWNHLSALATLNTNRHYMSGDCAIVPGGIHDKSFLVLQRHGSSRTQSMWQSPAWGSNLHQEPMPLTQTQPGSGDPNSAGLLRTCINSTTWAPEK